MDRIEPKWTESNQNELNWIEYDQSGQNITEVKWMGPSGLTMTKVDRIGPEWTE